MRLGLYIFASIILMAVIGSFVYSVVPDNYISTAFGVPIDLPVAVWIVLPMVLLMVASIVHMMFYNAKNFFKFKKWEKDTNTLNDALYWSLLHEPKSHKFNISLVKQTASLLAVSNLKVDGAVDEASEKLRGALTLVSEIERGEYVDLKSKKLLNALSKDNPLVLKNLLNRIEKDENFSEEVLQFKENYSKELFKTALNKFALTANFAKARKYAKVFNKKSFIVMLERVTREDNLGINKEILDEFIVALESELECSDYLKIATLTMKQLSPDENLFLWREYQSKYHKAEIAYLYLLFDYEMIESAGEYLDEHDEEDFKRFRALYDLKKEHKKYKITDLMNVRHICDA
jgi:ABC-type multidrug transport system fused ATPase/permease subunit